MARFVNIDFPVQHGGVTRFARGFAALGSFSITTAALHGLAVIGSPVTRATVGAAKVLANWTAARRQRQADRKLWDLALSDARVMADLSRAMTREASDLRRYY